MAEQPSELADEDLAWVTIIIVVAAAIMVSVVVVTRVILSKVSVGSGFGLPIFLGISVGVGYGIVAYLALRAGRTGAPSKPPQQ